MVDERHSSDGPVVFCLHYLGGSAREWAGVADALEGPRYVPIDLPGFGDATDVAGYTVADMATHVERAIRAHAPETWLVAGHSMGAKVTAALARRIEDGAIELPGLIGVVLLAGSPPRPEPMDDAQRKKMLGYFTGDAGAARRDAATFVDDNHGPALEAPARTLAIDDALRANRAAWVAWLESGSREDWRRRIGVLAVPALILAGSDDPQLGPDAQQAFTAPHYADVRSIAFAATKHLLPLERPVEVARAIDAFARELTYRALIASERVSANTRDVLEARGRSDDSKYRPQAMKRRAFATLRALVERALPQRGATPIDLAARIDTELAAKQSDGWRFAALPPDIDAYRAGLQTLDDAANDAHGMPFCELDAAGRDALIARMANGSLEAADAKTLNRRLDARQMRLWFEDVRAAATRAYMSHPATFARIGYSGIAYGGDGEPKAGFARIGPGERDAWEPLAAPETRA